MPGLMNRLEIIANHVSQSQKEVATEQNAAEHTQISARTIRESNAVRISSAQDILSKKETLYITCKTYESSVCEANRKGTNHF